MDYIHRCPGTPPSASAPTCIVLDALKAPLTPRQQYAHLPVVHIQVYTEHVERTRGAHARAARARVFPHLRLLCMYASVTRVGVQHAFAATGPAARLLPDEQARRRVRRACGDPRDQLLAVMAHPLLPQGRRNDVDVLGDRVDPSVDCRRYW